MEKSTTPGMLYSAIGKNLDSVQHYLKETYVEKKAAIAEGLSFFKDELSNTFDKTGRYINHIALPVNNFLKDMAEIERELKEELSRDGEYCICLDGKMVPASEVFSRPMEENY